MVNPSGVLSMQFRTQVQRRPFAAQQALVRWMARVSLDRNDVLALSFNDHPTAYAAIRTGGAGALGRAQTELLGR